MVQFAACHDVEQLLAVVHPRHARFYKGYMAFEQIADERAYPSVQNNPAVALCLDLNKIKRDPPKNYAMFFGEALPVEQLQARPIDAVDQAHFERIIQAAAPAISLPV
jgi:hypothetical protein